jgi:hypothetical protein
MIYYLAINYREPQGNYELHYATKGNDHALCERPIAVTDVAALPYGKNVCGDCTDIRRAGPPRRQKRS